MYCRNFTVFCSFFDIKKQKPKTNFEKCYQCSVNIEIFLDLKVYFSLVMSKIDNLIALRSTNQVTKISAPWWLRKENWHVIWSIFQIIGDPSQLKQICCE